MTNNLLFTTYIFLQNLETYDKHEGNQEEW